MKKSRVASFVLAGVAGVAGLALAATFSYFQQAGSADYSGDTVTEVNDTISHNDMSLGNVPWSGEDYTQDDSSFAQGAATTPVPANAVHSTIYLTNNNTEARQVVRLVNVLPDGPDDLYSDIWVRIERNDPTGAGGANQFKYFGPLSELRDIYMGNIVEGATQTFDVLAWTANAQEPGAYHTDFTVNYSVYDGAFEEAPSAG